MRAGRTVRLVRSAVSAASQIRSRYSHHSLSCGRKARSRVTGDLVPGGVSPRRPHGLRPASGWSAAAGRTVGAKYHNAHQLLSLLTRNPAVASSRNAPPAQADVTGQPISTSIDLFAVETAC